MKSPFFAVAPSLMGMPMYLFTRTWVNGNVLDTRAVSSLVNGQYLIWNLARLGNDPRHE